MDAAQTLRAVWVGLLPPGMIGAALAGIAQGQIPGLAPFQQGHAWMQGALQQAGAGAHELRAPGFLWAAPQSIRLSRWRFAV